MGRILTSVLMGSLLVLSLGAALMACDNEGGDVVGSCTIQDMVCTEYTGTGFTSDGVRETCGDSGIYRAGPCSIAGAVGSCTYDRGEPSEHAMFYYQGEASWYQEDCELAEGTWRAYAG